MMLTMAQTGIGRFTIVDNTVVSEADLGVNFFLDESSLGKMRAQCSTELLLELNPEVQGDWYPKSEVWTNTAPSLAGDRQIRLV
jgi:amyloid beta precursor protein binding protein 1